MHKHNSLTVRCYQEKIPTVQLPGFPHGDGDQITQKEGSANKKRSLQDNSFCRYSSQSNEKEIKNYNSVPS